MAKISLAAFSAGAAVVGVGAQAYTSYQSNKARKRQQVLEARKQGVRAARERRKLISQARRNRATALVQGHFQGGLGSSQQGAASNQVTQATTGVSFINQIQGFTERSTRLANRAATYDNYGNIIRRSSNAVQQYHSNFG